MNCSTVTIASCAGEIPGAPRVPYSARNASSEHGQQDGNSSPCTDPVKPGTPRTPTRRDTATARRTGSVSQRAGFPAPAASSPWRGTPERQVMPGVHDALGILTLTGHTHEVSMSCGRATDSPPVRLEKTATPA